MTDALDGWLDRKKQSPIWRLCATITASAKHQRALGGRGEFAAVTLTGVPADTFSFVSRVKWPDGDGYDDVVENAVLDGLLCSGFYNLTGVAISLDQIQWHEVDSNRFGFYWATRTAITELAGLDRLGQPKNFVRPRQAR